MIRRVLAWLAASLLLALALLIATITLGRGRATVVQGAVHLVLFASFLFLTVVP